MAAQADVAIIGGGIGLLHAVDDAYKAGLKVIACVGNPFLEFPLGACPFLVNPDLHSNFVCGDPELWKQKGVEYVFGTVTEIEPQSKTVRIAGAGDVTAKAIIVATGSKLPLIMPKTGDSLDQRSAEVKAAGAAIRKAETIVVNGAGLVGVEMAGDVRAIHPDKKVILLSRDGKVLGSTHPADWQDRVKAVLDKMNIEVRKGAVPREFCEPKLEAGSVTLDTGEILTYDVFLPCFAQGPNTSFLARAEGALDDRGRIIANECLQSTKYPEIFGVGVTTQPLVGHPVSARITAQSKTCVKNVKLLVNGKQPEPHKDKESPPGHEGQLPMNVKIGHGKGGYLIWDATGMPPPAKCCCCLPCKGGFPCCPPPCCWCCAPGCATCCGKCGGPAEGPGGAVLMLDFMLFKFMDGHLYKGRGKMPPGSQQKMS